MKRILVLLLLLMFSQLALGDVTGITFDVAPAADLNPEDTNALVMKIDVADNGSGDTMTGVALKNGGTADQPDEISAVRLWYQPAGGSFDASSAVYVTTVPKTALKTWADSSFTLSIADGSSVYVTVDVSSNPVNNSTIKMTLLKNGAVFTAGGVFPTKNTTNSETQTILNPPRLLVGHTDVAPLKVNVGQSDVAMFRIDLSSSDVVQSSITDLRIYAINNAGTIPFDSVVSRIVLEDAAGVAVADTSVIPSTDYIDINLTGTVAVSSNASDSITVKYYLLPGINTKDIGVRLNQSSDIVIASGIPVEAVSGHVFPMDSILSELTQPVSSVNVTSSDIAPVYATDQQADVEMIRLRLTHPQAVTTYADSIVSGITITAGSATTPAFLDSDLFTRITVSDDSLTYADFTNMLDVNEIFIPFDNDIVITAGSYVDVTISVDLKQNLAGENFQINIAATDAIAASDGSDNTVITVSGAAPFTSSYVTVQNAPTSAGVHHINRMPATGNTGQTGIYTSDLIFTHPDTGNYASIEIRGITLTVEDNLGNGIIPSDVISAVTLIDSLNNTVASVSAIPVSGATVFVPLSAPVILSPGATETLKVLTDIVLMPNETFMKLNLNSASDIYVLDGNSAAMVAASADNGDSFPMKTSAMEILNAAVDVKMVSLSVADKNVNMGQQDVTMVSYYFFNDQGGVVSIEGLTFDVFDISDSIIPENSVVDNVRVEDASNTTVVYADTAVTGTGGQITIPFSSPLLVNYGEPQGVTINVKFNIADPATWTGFSLVTDSSSYIDSRDYNSGLTVTAAAYMATYPIESGFAFIQERADALNVSHDGTNSGSGAKGDSDVHIMELIFENPLTGLNPGSVIITGLTLTVEDSSIPINADYALSRIYLEDSQSLTVYGEITAIPSGEYLYFDLTQPLEIPAGAGSNVTVNVKVDIASFATASEFRLNLESAGMVGAFDENERKYVTVSAKAPDSFPDMRSDIITIASSNKVAVLHTDTMPATASQGQMGVSPMSIRFANATDSSLDIHGVTLTVEDILDSGIIPDTFIDAVYLVDDLGNTNLSTSAIPSTGDKMYLTFTSDLSIASASYRTLYVYVDLKSNTFNSGFKLDLAGAANIDTIPGTLTVVSDSGDSFPMKTSAVQMQYVPVQGGISHTDVIPTTVSTGQTDIFAEILTISNGNVTGSADVMLTGITLTVEDDTNSVIDPTTAIKRILVRDSDTVYTFFSAIPSSVSSFYVTFDTPVSVAVAESKDLKVYVDIVDTLSASSFQINLKIDANIEFKDANSRVNISAVPINGDSFPMKTSTVIIQEQAVNAKVSDSDLMPAAVNRSQKNIQTMKLTFSNSGNANGANLLITRIILGFEDILDAGIIPKTAVSRLYITDNSGTVYGDVVSVPDYGDSVSIGLTTPITVQAGELKEVFVKCEINSAATAPGFKIDLKTSSGIIARDANSYEIISVSALSGYSFPMRSGYALIQNKSDVISVRHYQSMPATVDKGDTGVESMYLEFVNNNPAGYSAVRVVGVTITTENNIGSGVVPDTVLSGLILSDGSAVTYGSASVIPSAGSTVYIPLDQNDLVIPAGTYAGVTLFSDILPATSELYVQLDLKNAINVEIIDINSSESVSSVTADAADSFPMRSGYATVNSPPGIEVSYSDHVPASVSGLQHNVLLLSYHFDNIGSFNSAVEGITLTVKDSGGNDADASALFDRIIVVDDLSNTVSSLNAVPTGSKVYLPMTITSFTVPPQDYLEAYIFADFVSGVASGDYYFGVSLSADIETASPVTPKTPETFPMYSSVVSAQNAVSGVNILWTDRMPPTVSTGQSGVRAFELVVQNPGSAGDSAAVVYGVTITVQDSASASVNADTAVSRIVIKNTSNQFADTASIPSSDKLYISFPQPVTVAAGASVTTIFEVDVTSDNISKADEFRLMIAGASDILVRDYNSDALVAVTGLFPVESSTALIQKKAENLSVVMSDVMPANVSTDQENVSAMNLILTDVGDSDTSAIMVNRINFYVQESSDVDIADPKDVIKSLKVMSQDGTVLYGQDAVLSTTKITVNLTSPVIIPSDSSVTVSVRFNAASTYAFDSFKITLDSAADMYALDANSFELITNVNGTFPMRSSTAAIEENIASIDVNGFSGILGAGVTKGDRWVPLFVFKIDGSANTLSANSEFRAITVTVRDSGDSDISADTVIETLYVVDGSGNTLGATTPGVSNLIPVKLTSPYLITNATYNYITVYADILNASTASDFKVLLQGPGHLSITDENSGIEISENATPSMPWETDLAAVYDAPATEMHVWSGINLGQSTIGRSVPNVQFMSLSFYNPGGQGTSEVVIEGITITVSDTSNNTLIPQDVVDNVRLTDSTGAVVYGSTTTTALASAERVYIEMYQPFEVNASNTKTVYVRADIAAAASLVTFRTRFVASSDINVHNNPTGAITVSASNGKTFPMYSEPPTEIQALSYNIEIGHENRMPVSAAKGQKDLSAMSLNVRNKNGIDIDVRGITLTVKNSAGSEISALDVIDRMKIKYDEVMYADIVPLASGKVFLAMTGLTVTAGDDISFDILIDIKSNASGSFYIEFEDGTDLYTLPMANAQAKAGDFFGNMKTTLVSLQEADLEDSFHAFPSPFNPEKEVMHIEYYLENDSEVTIKLFTLDGRLVKTVIDKAKKAAGLHYEDTWDAVTGNGGTARSGVYLCMIDVDGKKLIRKIVVLR